MENLLDVAGVTALVVVILNILAYFKVITGESKEELANAVQLLVSVALTVVGTFAPDLLDKVPVLDGAAQALSELGALVIPVYLAIIKVGNAFHDALAKLPGVNKFFGYQLTP